MQEVKINFDYTKNEFLLTIKSNLVEKIIKDKLENINKILFEEGI